MGAAPAPSALGEPRMKRSRVFRVALVVVAVLGLAVLGLRLYLSSGAVARLAADQLTGMLGSPVEVGGASVGLVGGTSLRGLRVHEPDGPDEPPLLEVDELRVSSS